MKVRDVQTLLREKYFVLNLSDSLELGFISQPVSLKVFRDENVYKHIFFDFY